MGLFPEKNVSLAGLFVQCPRLHSGKPKQFCQSIHVVSWWSPDIKNKKHVVMLRVLNWVRLWKSFMHHTLLGNLSHVPWERKVRDVLSCSTTSPEESHPDCQPRGDLASVNHILCLPVILANMMAFDWLSLIFLRQRKLRNCQHNSLYILHSIC